jgi:hypothetical protein
MAFSVLETFERVWQVNRNSFLCNIRIGMVVTFHNPGVIVSGHLLSVRDESPFQLIIAPRPALGLVFTSFPKRATTLAA